MARTFLAAITGSFAERAAENPTVAMIEAAYTHHGIDARYVNCEVAADDLADAVRGARAMGWAGFNCSLPHKIHVIAQLDRLGASARIIGAVNCVVRDGRDLVGENTDGKGFLESLRTVHEPAGTAAVVLGAGGAARAIAVELALAGARQVTIVARRPEPAADLARLVETRTSAASRALPWGDRFRVPDDTDVLIHATPVGMAPDPARPAIDLDTLDRRTVVADVIANPPRTPLLRRAQELGCPTLDGLGMLVNQGAVAIALWTGVDPDRDVMRRRLTEIFDA